MMWTCIECEFKFDDNGDSEERMCDSCLNKQETEKRENELMEEEKTITRYIMKCKAGKYEASSIWGLAFQILKHRTQHLIAERKWRD